MINPTNTNNITLEEINHNVHSIPVILEIPMIHDVMGVYSDLEIKIKN